MKTKTTFEILVWKNAENVQEPIYRDEYQTEEKAMRMARSIYVKNYGRVEVNRVVFNPDIPISNVIDLALVASWENGVRLS